MSDDRKEAHSTSARKSVSDEAILAAHERFETHTEAAKAVGLSRRRYTARASALGIWAKHGGGPKTSDDELGLAVSMSSSLEETAQVVGRSVATVKRRVAKLNLSVKHWPATPDPERRAASPGNRLELPKPKTWKAIREELDTIADPEEKKRRVVAMMMEAAARLRGDTTPVPAASGTSNETETPAG